MSVTANRERGVTVEDVVCDHWLLNPPPPAGDKRGLWYSPGYRDTANGEDTCK